MLFDEMKYKNKKKIHSLRSFFFYIPWFMGTIFEKIYFYIFLFYFISFGKFIGLCMKCIRNVNHHFESNKIQDQKKKCYRERAFKDYAMWLYKIYSVFFYFFYKNLKKIVVKKKCLIPFSCHPEKFILLL